MDRLRSDDLSERREAMNALPAIALSLGPERTSRELLGDFLPKVIPDEEDEVLAVLGARLADLPRLDFYPMDEQQLGDDDALRQKRVDAAAGILQRIVPLLEQLAGSEEMAVRMSALQAFTSIIIPENFDAGDILSPIVTAEWVGHHFWPVVERMSKGPWMGQRWFGAKLLAVLLERYLVVRQFA